MGGSLLSSLNGHQDREGNLLLLQHTCMRTYTPLTRKKCHHAFSRASCAFMQGGSPPPLPSVFSLIAFSLRLPMSFKAIRQGTEGKLISQISPRLPPSSFLALERCPFEEKKEDGSGRSTTACFPLFPAKIYTGKTFSFEKRVSSGHFVRSRGEAKD